LQDLLANLPVQVQPLDDCSLVLEVPLNAKLDVMRQILTLPGVQDLEIQAPTLESLYLHFNSVCHTPLSI